VIIRKLAVMLLSACLVTVLLESGLRWAAYDPNPSPVWRYSPTLGWTMDPRSSRIPGVNATGFRFHPVPREKPPGEGRILVLGDSFTAGISLPFDSTIPGRLEAWLGREKKIWHVISLAVDDWGNAQELLALQELGLQFDPDAVVIQTFPFNDFCNNCRVLANTCSLQDLHRPYFTLRDGRLVRSDLAPWRAYLRSRLRLFSLVENAFGTPVGSLPDDFLPAESNQDLRRRAYFRSQAQSHGLDSEGAVYSVTDDANQPAPIRDCWKTTEAILRSIKETTDRRKIPLVALVIPFLKSFPDEWTSLTDVFDAPIEQDYDTHRFERIFADLGVPTISARSRIAASDMQYLDYFLSPENGHLSAFGHAECASWILSALQPLVGLSDAGPTVELTDADLIRGVADWEIAERGLGERLPVRSSTRIGAGREIELEFRNRRFTRVLVSLDAEALQDGMRLRLAVNEKAISVSRILKRGERWVFEESVPAHPGRNVVTFELESDAVTGASGSPAPRIRFHRLELIGIRDQGRDSREAGNPGN
jgi:hypothetical protein